MRWSQDERLRLLQDVRLSRDWKLLQDVNGGQEHEVQSELHALIELRALNLRLPVSVATPQLLGYTW